MATKINFSQDGSRYIATYNSTGETRLIGVEFLNVGSVRPSLQVQMRLDSSFAWATEATIHPDNGGKVANFTIKYPNGTQVRLVSNTRVSCKYVTA